MLDAFYQNPMQYIGLVFALIGAFGAIYFIFGFLAGLPHVFTLNSNNHHQHNHRFRVTWGLMIMMAAFIVWELLRIVASWFGYPPANLAPFGFFLFVLFVFLLICGIVVAITNIITNSGGH